MPIPGMGAFAAQARKKMGGGGAPPPKGGPPGGNKPDGVHPHASGKPGDIAGGDRQKDAKQIAAAQVARVRAGKVDQQLVKLMKGFDPDDGYPKWAADEKAWEEAEAAVQPDGDGRHLDDPWLVVAHVYKALGGKINPGAQSGDGGGKPPPGDEDHDGGDDHDHGHDYTGEDD